MINMGEREGGMFNALIVLTKGYFPRFFRAISNA